MIGVEIDTLLHAVYHILLSLKRKTQNLFFRLRFRYEMRPNQMFLRFRENMIVITGYVQAVLGGCVMYPVSESVGRMGDVRASVILRETHSLGLHASPLVKNRATYLPQRLTTA